jgi:hypothetical protein
LPAATGVGPARNIPETPGEPAVPPLSLDLECIAIIRDHAQPLLPRTRPAFFEKVTELLRGVPRHLWSRLRRGTEDVPRRAGRGPRIAAPAADAAAAVAIPAARVEASEFSVKNLGHFATSASLLKADMRADIVLRR